MADSTDPIDYHRPTPSGNIGANFGLGLVTGLAASGIAAGIARAAKDVRYC